MDGRYSEFLRKGWIAFAAEESVRAWVRAARPVGLAAGSDPKLRRRWLRCGGTWFVGVNALGNAPDGSLPEKGVPPLAGDALRFLREHVGAHALDSAQVSIVYPGYPRQGADESDAAFRYRVRRHAAHVDGFERVMPGRRRRLSELHALVLGIPLTETSRRASPLSVWEGSHEVFRAVFRRFLSGVEPARWREVDCTKAYAEARARSLDSCRRVSVAAVPGEAYAVHRLALHGIGPWAAPSGCTERMVAYFRPEISSAPLPERWLLDP